MWNLRTAATRRARRASHSRRSSMHVMKRFAAAAVAAFVLGSGAAWAAHHEVKVSNGHLTDTKGRSLYFFKKDSDGKSACSGECVQK